MHTSIGMNVDDERRKLEDVVAVVAQKPTFHLRHFTRVPVILTRPQVYSYISFP